ncbi:hypothetical protein HVZ29_08255 [Escherichia coli]|nr:hypothetical protein FEM44_19810 [Escherichia sp. E4742]QLN18813.1 hypothetical protein HVZ29_08255 [Escherichia coli]QML55954.1 hypothetical protein HVX32_07945 [Escherichia coli]TLJ08499.1 hypothetical protein FEK62_19810 [Escherichia sp. E4742]
MRHWISQNSIRLPRGAFFISSVCTYPCTHIER